MTDNIENKIKELKGFSSHFNIDPDLEEKVIVLVKKKQFFRERTFSKKILMAAAIIFSFVLGYLTQYTNQKTDGKPGSLYAVFVYENENFQYKDLSEMAEEYLNWVRKTAETRKFMDGYELDYQVATMSSDSITSNYGLLTGLFIFDANSINEVKKLVRNHPHLKYKGRLTIRKIIQR